MDKLQIVNLSKRTMTETEIKVLKHGLNFCPLKRMDLAQTRIDIYHYVRKTKLAKIFAENKKMLEHKKPLQLPTETLTVRDAEPLLTLINLDNTNPDHEIVLTTVCEQIGSSLSGMKPKSRFYPQLPPGNKIDIFQEAVTQDIYKIKPLRYKDNLTKEERTAIQDLTQDDQIEIKIADKGGNIIIWDKIRLC